MTQEWTMPGGWDVSQQVSADRYYSHAPITEALIEITCSPDTNVTLEDLAQTVDPQIFTSKSAAIAVSGRIEVTPEGIKGDTAGEQIGHLFRHSDGHQVVQSRLNGFAYSLLAPYSDWQSFSSEALAQWHAYKDVARPSRVTRLGVRYVNKIDIPQPSIEIKDYLRTAVDVSPYLPQITVRYFLQIVVPVFSFDAVATITSTIVPPPTEQYTSLILDIDAWRELDLSLDTNAGEERLQEALGDLRNAKNYVFEACITDATRGLIA